MIQTERERKNINLHYASCLFLFYNSKTVLLFIQKLSLQTKLKCVCVCVKTQQSKKILYYEQ